MHLFVVRHGHGVFFSITCLIDFVCVCVCVLYSFILGRVVRRFVDL